MSIPKKYFEGQAGKFLKVADDEYGLEFVESTPGSGDMVAANNLSDVEDADAARDNLNAQEHDTDLDAIAALNSTIPGVIANEGGGWLQKTYAQLKTLLVLVKGDVGLGNLDNTSDVNKPVSTAQQTAIDDAEAAANTYTDDEIDTLKDGVSGSGDTLQKLYNLIVGSFQEVTAANIAARNAYNVPSLPFHIFVTDDGDGNWALYKATSTGVGATFVKISDPDLLNAVMSNSAIKTAYESNSDTNAFTNALLAKLNGIAAGATANDSDVNLKARGNHTGSQAATTITEDSTHRFATDTEKGTWNGKSDLGLGETSGTAYRGDRGKIAYDHSQAAHAPSNAQKNSDILKAEIEAVLTGVIASHSHAVSDLDSVISAPSTISANKNRTIGGRYFLDDRLTVDGRLTLI